MIDETADARHLGSFAPSISPGAWLQISARMIQYHLGKVLTRLGIGNARRTAVPRDAVTGRRGPQRAAHGLDRPERDGIHA